MQFRSATSIDSSFAVFCGLVCTSIGIGICDVAVAVHPVVPGFTRFYDKPDSDGFRAGRLLLGELNCTSCHQADSRFQQHLLLKQAPVLDNVGARIKIKYLRKFLTDPHSVKPGTTMPNLFSAVPAAERKQQVEALVHFLAATGTVQETFPDKAAAGRGNELFHRVGCVACHGAQSEGASKLATSVPLGDLNAKYTINSLAAFLRDPHKVRPSGRMPNLNLNDKEARDIAGYFVTEADIKPNLTYKYFEGTWDNVPDFGGMKPKSTGEAAGFDLNVAPRKNNFGLRFEGYLRIQKEGDYTFHLGSDDGSRMLVDGKEVVNVDGVHPLQFKSAKLRLSPGVHPLIVDYFQGGGEWVLKVDYQGPGLGRQPVAGAVSATREVKTKPGKDEFVLDPSLAAEGRKLFASVGCASCHQLTEQNKRIASTLSAPPLKTLKPNRGCLSTAPARGIPRFDPSKRQHVTLTSAIISSVLPVKPESPQMTITNTMTTFNCYACHARDKTGGVETARNPSFVGQIQEMGDEGRIPPLLDGVGDKLQPAYLKNVLQNGPKDRPYMLARMPKFGLSNVDQLVAAFEKADGKDDSLRPKFAEPIHRMKSSGRFLVGDKALSCIKCHTFGKHKATGIQSIDLTTMTKRLREDWFYRYMLDPQEYRPGTRMPGGWPRGVSVVPAVLEGDTPQQLAAVWTYLADGQKAPIPTGLGGTPIELVADKEPVIYRNFIEGLSPRGIAVGYPEKANIAFDADRFSLALIWHGAFIDASKHWRGRGQGFQPPLGDHVFSLVNGVPFAELESGATAWPTESPKKLGYRFSGYRLDKDRRPVFRYRVGDIEIEDFPKPVADKKYPSIERTITLSGNPPSGGLWYRAAVAARIEKAEDGWYLLDGAIRIRVKQQGGSPPVLRKSGNRFELLVPVRFSQNKARVVQEYVW